MNQLQVTLENFKNTLNTYGADFTKWPSSERDAAIVFINQSDDAKALLMKMGIFEKILTSYNDSLPPRDLLDRIINKAYSET